MSGRPPPSSTTVQNIVRTRPPQTVGSSTCQRNRVSSIQDRSSAVRWKVEVAMPIRTRVAAAASVQPFQPGTGPSAPVTRWWPRCRSSSS